MPHSTRLPALVAASIALLVTACATPVGPSARTAVIQRTALGVPHISAPDIETPA